MNLFFPHFLSHPMSFHGSDLTRVTVSSRVNEVFTQLVRVFIFCRTRRKQDDSLHTHCANLNTLVARPIIVEIWRTFFGALGASAICSFAFSRMDVYHRVSWCCFVGSLTFSTLSGTSCDSTCEPFRCMFLSLDVRLNIHVARSVALTLFITVALLCLRPYHRLDRNLSHPPRKCVHLRPNPKS